MAEDAQKVTSMDLIETVRSSYDRCCSNGDFPGTFYDIFFTKSPEIPKLFAHTDFTQQKRPFRAALLLLIPGPGVALGGIELPVFDLAGLAVLAAVVVVNLGHRKTA